MRDLLDFSRPASLTWSPEPVAGILEEVRSICAPLARSLGAILTCDSSDGIPEILMDRPRIVQVFQNLVDNAIRHSPRGGRVLVAAALEGEGSFRNVVVRIRDEGPGFSESALRRAFEPFFTERPSGTGLGLSIVDRIVRQHGAKILIGNGDRGGAVVTIRFPFAALDDGTPEGSAASALAASESQ
jgi:two-component system sensor histidine kinase FlrB